MANYSTNPYGYYETMKDSGSYQEERQKAYADYAKNGGCRIQPNNSLGESVKAYYRQHGYV